MVKLLAGTRLRDTRQVSTRPTPRSAGRRPARWEIEELQGTSRPWDSSFWRRERLKGYLTILTVTNVVGELVGELNPRSVEVFLRFSNVI